MKTLHVKHQGVDRELLARVEALGATLRPTPVVRLAHPRLPRAGSISTRGYSVERKAGINPVAKGGQQWNPEPPYSSD